MEFVRHRHTASCHQCIRCHDRRAARRRAQQGKVPRIGGRTDRSPYRSRGRPRSAEGGHHRGRRHAGNPGREARNGGEFLARIEAETGIRPRVITGTEEARLIHQAAVYGVDVGSARAVVIDIGGGSTEITLGTATSTQAAKSFKIGVIRLTERFVKSDPLSGRDEQKLTKHVISEIDRHCEQITSTGFDRVIGTSGTILSLGAVATAISDGTVPGELRNLRVPAKQIRRLRKEVVALSLAQRLTIPGLDPRRADLVVAGAVLLDAILRRLGAEDITLCDLALREGLVLDYIRRNSKHIAHVDSIPDVRRRSSVELAERCNYYSEHAHQVVRLALALFDQTRAVHGLTDRERDWLEFAALLHDIGTHISYERHHRHSYYLIRNGDLRGFDPDEIEVVALVARYHRRGTPKRSHDEYARLPSPLRRTVRTLSSILRVAESLDRSHTQTISGLEFRDRGDDALLLVHTTGDAELEVWATNRHLQPFEQLLGKPVRLEAAAHAPLERRPVRTAEPAEGRPRAAGPRQQRRRTQGRAQA